MGLFSSTLKKERKLEKQGEIWELQEYRRYKTYQFYEDSSTYHGRCPEFLQTELRLREIAQREIFLEEEIERTGVAESKLEATQEEIQNLKQEYFLAEQKNNRWRADIACGSMRRGLDLWRSHPQWYLHKTLSDDCADRGGCCGRACGCCRDRKLRPERQSGAGHCTVECGCCQQFRGFALTDEAKETMKKLYPLDPKKNFSYCLKIYRASIFGLDGDSTKSPFDLIDKPPGYEQDN
ncbi:uncharacterized protein N7459_009114 [Penicillium hispanicum]|uniref:uncharacterized protein n=1 Tax=Penicillium hispanicum TaxID=1080232 RepID=UPI00253FA896|nr:uncharacterized protein N7459_009114 [Penicillium hispanicum]KAJ5569684.1 hypothetical protein N7459_009114 [Penicillium hispanicum]